MRRNKFKTRYERFERLEDRRMMAGDIDCRQMTSCKSQAAKTPT